MMALSNRKKFLDTHSFFSDGQQQVSSPNLPTSEYQALQDLYNATGGVDWKTSNWNFSDTANPCEDGWFGVGCTLLSPFDVYHVSNLTLAENDLLGTIPSSLGNLTQLSYVDFAHNAIYGTLPSELLWLPSLVILLVDDTEIENPLPPLPMGYNTSLSSLQVLGLSGMYMLSGTIPLDVFLQLPHLQILDLEGDVGLGGTLPAELLWAPNLVYLNLDSLSLFGPIPEPFQNVNVSLNRLEALILSFCMLSGTLPTQLAQLGQLRAIETVYNTHLSGDLSVLPASLRVVNLVANYFSGTMESLSSIAAGNLQVLTLDYNCIHGTIPNDICENKELVQISLELMSIRHSCSVRWFSHSAYLAKRPLEGTIPACLFSLPAIFSCRQPAYWDHTIQRKYVNGSPHRERRDRRSAQRVEWSFSS